MSDYSKLVKALRCKRDDCEGCDLAFFDKDEGWMCQYAAKDDDAADAIEALQAELEKKRTADFWGCKCEKIDPKLGKYVHGRESSREYIGDCLVSIDYEDWRCSVCGIVFEQWSMPTYNYCPNCGAKMEVQDADT